MNETKQRKIFNIGLEAYRIAKKVYKKGAFVYASDSAFLRAVLDDIINKNNR